MVYEIMEKNKIKSGLKKYLFITGSALFLFLLLAGIASVFAVDSLVDIWWFDAAGYGFLYWQRLLYRYVVLGGVSLFFFIFFFSNFWIASRVLRRLPTDGQKAGQRPRSRIIKAFQTGSLLFYAPLSLVLSIPLSMPLYHHWEKFLFYVFGPKTGISEPFFNMDVSFYLFSYPIYSLLQLRLLLALVVLLVALLVMYAVKNRLLTHHLLKFSGVAKWHLGIVLLAIFGMEIWDFLLQRYALVYDPGHMPLFSGPGYIQMKVVLPLIWLGIVFSAAAAIGLVVVLKFQKGYKTVLGIVVCLALILGARHTPYLSDFIEGYWVKPNEVVRESPYISKSVKAALDAYNLSHIDTRKFEHQRFPVNINVAQVRKVLRNVPVWDAETLDNVFEQLQELRTYYSFPGVNVGRYTVGGNYQQVFLSMRELNYEKLPGDTQNWINTHLLYTHGYGAVMAPASQLSGSQLTWFLSNIPPESDFGLDLAQPRIYYGLQKYPYAIAPSGVDELDYPAGGSNAKTNYQGKGGVPVSSLMRKFLFAYYFRDKNIFLSTKINDQSKVLFRRQIIRRIETLAPFLLLDDAPYAVYTPKGLFWMVDAYTHSSAYPVSPEVTLNNTRLNYVRNSVKIVVDAYNGNVDFYIYDEKDPIISAYDRIYPGLFKHKDKMPEDLKAHTRYPRELFDTQMQVYAKYHQTDPQVFFQQEDLWTFAEAEGEAITVPDKPYYLTLDLINSGNLDFLLLVPMFPKGKDNLRAMAIAGCDGDNYGKLIVYDFPKGQLVYGPAQIDALINQEPSIAEQFTLWDQAGSSVVRGKMIILPVENSVFFIQPVYLKATSRVKIPELQRIIMSEGRIAVMKRSLEDAYVELQQRVRQEQMGIEETILKAPLPHAGEDETVSDENPDQADHGEASGENNNAE